MAKVVNNWASEASPTLGCSIEISRDIYICVCFGPKSVAELRGQKVCMLTVSIEQ